MARWEEFFEAEPVFGRRVLAYLDAGRHKTIATLRRDGAPRISGIEASVHEGDLWFGSMGGARKAVDLQRDPRFALHSASVDPPAWDGDAKVNGRAEEVTDVGRVTEIFGLMGSEEAAEDSHLFRAEIEDVALVRLADHRDHLIVELWRAGEGLKRMERR